MTQQSDVVKFPINEVGEILNTEKVVCVFGYGVSEGFVSAHFYTPSNSSLNMQ